jgi:hypothetical protein
MSLQQFALADLPCEWDMAVMLFGHNCISGECNKHGLAKTKGLLNWPKSIVFVV